VPRADFLLAKQFLLTRPRDLGLVTNLPSKPDFCRSSSTYRSNLARTKFGAALKKLIERSIGRSEKE